MDVCLQSGFRHVLLLKSKCELPTIGLAVIHLIMSYRNSMLGALQKHHNLQDPVVSHRIKDHKE